MAEIGRRAAGAAPMHEGHREVHVGTESTDGGCHKLERGLDLGTIGVTSPEFWGINHCVHNSADIAMGTLESLRHTSDKCRRRIVRNKSPRELGRNKFCGAGIFYEKLDDLLTVFHSTGVDLFPEQDFRLGIVNTFVKLELWIFTR